jgi:hypothetical protein
MNIEKEISDIYRDRKSVKIYGYMFFAYFVFSAVAWGVGIHEKKTAIEFSIFVSDIIPSLREIAAISKDGNYARFILSASWVYILVTWLVILRNLDWRSSANSWRAAMSSAPIWVRCLLPLLPPVFFIGILFFAPTPSSAHIGRSVFYGIQNSHVFLVVFASGLWAAGSLMLHGVAVAVYAKFFHDWRNKK